jgi:hypothetical protein
MTDAVPEVHRVYWLADRIRDLLDDTVIDENLAVASLAVALGQRVGMRASSLEVCEANLRVALEIAVVLGFETWCVKGLG